MGSFRKIAARSEERQHATTPTGLQAARSPTAGLATCSSAPPAGTDGADPEPELRRGIFHSAGMMIAEYGSNETSCRISSLPAVAWGSAPPTIVTSTASGVATG